MKNSIDCVDAGSENCPCYLAVTDDCLICSRLQGKDCCDCNWKGVCIYNEFIQGNRRVNNPRKDFPAEIVKIKYYLDDLVAITLQVGKGFALKASRPGSYIFLRKEDSENFYETPLCVMAADIENEQVTITIKVISAKTKTIIEAKDRLMVRGVYRNGILGINEITDRNVKDKKILLVVKGIGLAPAMLTANYLWLKNRVDLVIDRDKVSEDLIADFLGDGQGIIKYMNLADDTDQNELRDLLIRENYDTVIILASDHFIKLVGKMVKVAIPQAKLAISNNFNICCGEGVCGACSVVNSKGESFKMCKCQNVLLEDLM